MENIFNGESYSLGWIESKFVHTKKIGILEAERYICLSKELNQEMNSEILKYIEMNYYDSLVLIN